MSRISDSMRGDASEALVETILNDMVIKGGDKEDRNRSVDEVSLTTNEQTVRPDRPSHPTVESFERVEKNSSLDRQGVDFLVKLREVPEKIGLQVKSSWRRARKFDRWARANGKLIFTVVANTELGIDIVKRHVMGVLKVAFNVYRHYRNKVTWFIRKKYPEDTDRVERQKRRFRRRFGRFLRPNFGHCGHY